MVWTATIHANPSSFGAIDLDGIDPAKRASRMRHLALGLGNLALVGPVVRRAEASDPGMLEIGGSTGGNDAQATFGPDVRLHHASAGFHHDAPRASAPGASAPGGFNWSAGGGLTITFGAD